MAKNVTWREAPYGAIRFPSCTAKVRYFLKLYYNRRCPKRSRYSQSEIARMCKVTAPLVNQILHAAR